MSEIRIAIPDLDLNNALRLDGSLRNYEIGPSDDVVLDFSRMTNFDPLPMLMAGAIIMITLSLFLASTGKAMPGRWVSSNTYPNP